MKYLTLIGLALAATTAQADFWDNCTAYGGTIITANSYGNDKGGLCNDPSNPDLTNNCNGKKFCIGGNGMNWWSAFTWCESIGGHLASFAHACPEISQVNNVICPNLKNVHNATLWTSSGYGSDNAVLIEKSTVHLDYFGRNAIKHGGWGNTVALCEE